MTQPEWVVVRAAIEHDRVVTVTFVDGSVKTMDLSPWLTGPVFERIATDIDAFNQMYVDGETICWPGDLDIAPERLYDPDGTIFDWSS
jgi:prepilin-type processing-associated H-X9-DG protein